MSKAQIDLTATDKTKAAFDSAKKNLQGLGEQAAALPASLGAIGVALAAAGSVGGIKGIIDAADALFKLSQKTGIAVESLSELQYAGSLADVSIESIAKGVKTLSTNMFDASTGSKEAAANFKLVGVSIKNADGSLRSTDSVLGDVANTFAKLADGPEKAALAVKLFGKAGMDLIPLLNGGKEGLEAMRLEAQQLGVVISTETAKAAEEFNDNLTRISALSSATGKDIASGLLPVLVELTTAFIEARKEGGGLGSMFLDGLRTAFEAVVVLGANVAYVMKGIGIEIGGLAAQAVSIARLDFSGAAEIGRAMKSDALDNRRKVDDFSNRILNARESKRLEASAGGGFGDGSIGRSSGKQSTLGLKDTAGAEAAAKAANKELEKQAKVMAELSGLTGTFAEDWDRLNAIYAKGGMSLKQLTEYQAILLGKQPAIKAAADAEAAMYAARDKSTAEEEKYIAGLVDENEAYAKGNRTLFEEVEAIGLSAEALNILRLARLDANISKEEELLLGARAKTNNQNEIEQFQWRIKLMREERGLKAEGFVKEQRAAEIEDNKKRTEGISQSISEGLIDGFRNGKSLGDIFLSELKAQFAKTVLQPLISPIVQGGNDAITDILKGGNGLFKYGGASNNPSAANYVNSMDAASDAAGGGGWLSAVGSLFSGLKFDGGGYTGNGLRTGGLDGKGGFMAMLHPQETVVDHTKGQKVERGNTVIHYHFENGTNRADLFAAVQQSRALARIDRNEDARRRR